MSAALQSQKNSKPQAIAKKQQSRDNLRLTQQKKSVKWLILSTKQ